MPLGVVLSHVYPSFLQARLEMLENKVKLSTQRSHLLETKAEKILEEQAIRPTGARNVSGLRCSNAFSAGTVVNIRRHIRGGPDERCRYHGMLRPRSLART